jgi:hypothetical protein
MSSSMFAPRSVAMARKRKSVEQPAAPEEPPQKKPNTATELPPGVHHYQYVEEVPWDIQK